MLRNGKQIGFVRINENSCDIKPFKRKMKINWANLKGPALILWTLILLGLLLTPFRETVNAKLGNPPYFDKIAHLGLFFITGIIIFLGATRFKRFRSRVLFTIIFGLFLAVSTEIVQLLILHRDLEHNIYRHLWPFLGNVYYTPYFDLIADIVGLGLALILIALLYRRTTFRAIFLSKDDNDIE